MANLNSESKYDQLLEQWKTTFVSKEKELTNEGKDVVLVAMSRKMQRLFEAIKKEYDTNKELKDYKIVSEHTLPYILKDFTSEPSQKKEIVILDDAIYHGSIINFITSYIKSISGIITKVIPVVANEEVIVNKEVNLPNANLFEGEGIKEEDILFFTTQNAKKIISLNRPIDVEFPILRFQRDKLSEKKEEKFDEVLKNHFIEEEWDTYSITHHIEGKNPKNYNVLPKKGNKYDRWNKDFCKLRFFVSDESVQVVSYAPAILSESSLNSEQPLFTNEKIQALWSNVKNYGMAEWPDINYTDNIDEKKNELSPDRIKNYYQMQCYRSKVVWANYLASFLFLLEQKDNIEKVVGEFFGESCAKTVKIDVEDTRLLLPPHLVDVVTQNLNNCFETEKEGSINSVYSSVLANQELTPEEYKDKYIELNRNGLQRCDTAKEALSIIFSNQLFIINGYENDSSRRSRRLRFGITYTALEKKLALPIGIEGLWRSIHEWIDKNIDEGTIKPKYDRVEFEGNYYWLRMFRAGENENSLIKMLRLCDFIIDKIQQKELRSYVERSVVEDLLTLAWEDPCKIINNEYKWDDSFLKEQEGSGYYLYYEYKKEKNKKLVDFLKNQEFFKYTEDSSNVQLLSRIDNSRVVTPLQTSQEQAISDYIDAYYFYKEEQNQPYIMNNFFQKEDFEKEKIKKGKNDLFNWRDIFSEYMKAKGIEEQHSNNDIPRKRKTKLDESLFEIISRTIKANKINEDIQENDNRKTIREYLAKKENGDYNQFRKMLLTATIISELFDQLILKSNEDLRKNTETLKGYLDRIESEDKIVKRYKNDILDYLNNCEKVGENNHDNKKYMIRALDEILKSQVK